jgi:hypothetical protein
MFIAPANSLVLKLCRSAIGKFRSSGARMVILPGAINISPL